MRLRRSDIGLFVSALAAAGLIVVFLAMTDGESTEAPPPTTTRTSDAVSPGRLLRTQSPQVPELAWSSARGAFRVECGPGATIRLDARITRLPPDRRYAWRVITGDANRTAPLTGRPDVDARLVEGVGLPSAFTPVNGSAAVRFTFSGRPPPAGLGLNVLDVDRLRSLVIATPPISCRG